MDAILKQVKQLKYKQPALVAALIQDVLQCFSYRVESYELERRKEVKLLSLVGNIPVPVIEKQVPIQIWLPIDFPLKPPIIKAVVGKTSLINPMGCVNTDGSVRHECLEQWDKSYGLVRCLKYLINEFRDVFPVFDLSHFKNATDAKKNLMEVLSHFPDSQLSWSNYINKMGQTSVELKLDVVIRDAVEVPIQVWIFKTFPKTAPYVKVLIDDEISEMMSNARLSHDYILKWKYPGASLLEFLELLKHDIFRERTSSASSRNKCQLYFIAVKEAEKEAEKASIATASSKSSDSASSISLQKKEKYPEMESFVEQAGLDKETEHILIANGFKTRRAILAMRVDDIYKLGLPLGQECLLRDELSKIKQLEQRKDYRASDNFSVSSMRSDDGDREYCKGMFARATKSLLKPLMVDESQLTIREEIGRGEFGVVYKGILQRSSAAPPVDVAVKTIFLSSHSKRLMDDFVEEILQMQKLNHKNILPLKALVILDCKPHMVLPFMANSDLRTYLLNPTKTFTVQNLVELGLDVARGMQYLTDQNFIHGDLAARNCLVDEDHTVKVGDFGLAKQLHLTEYYRLDMRDKRPVRWMAPETMFKRVYTFKSDVWSFGILMWEIMSRGKRPYPEIADTSVLIESIKNGYRMQCPPHTPSDICDLLSRCWKTEQNERPNFTNIVSLLEAVLQGESPSVENLTHRLGSSLRLTIDPSVGDKRSTGESPPVPPRVPHYTPVSNKSYSDG